MGVVCWVIVFSWFSSTTNPLYSGFLMSFPWHFLCWLQHFALFNLLNGTHPTHWVSTTNDVLGRLELGLDKKPFTLSRFVPSVVLRATTLVVVETQCVGEYTLRVGFRFKRSQIQFVVSHLWNVDYGSCQVLDIASRELFCSRSKEVHLRTEHSQSYSFTSFLMGFNVFSLTIPLHKNLWGLVVCCCCCDWWSTVGFNFVFSLTLALHT